MPPVVEPFVILAQWMGTYGGRPWVNTMHFVWDATGLDRSTENMAGIATELQGAWVGNIAPIVSDVVDLEEVRISDLDNEGASIGSIAGNWGGTHAADAMPPNVAMLITKNTTHGRGQKNGRWFQVGVPESYTTDVAPTVISAGPLALVEAGFAQFLTDVTLDISAVPSGAVTPVVLSKSAVTPGEFTPRAITSLTVDSTLATQRRRLRG